MNVHAPLKDRGKVVGGVIMVVDVEVDGEVGVLSGEVAVLAVVITILQVLLSTTFLT